MEFGITFSKYQDVWYFVYWTIFCGYTIEEQKSDSDLVISGPINFLGSNLKIRLSIVNNNNVFEATYKIPFVSLVVTFRELDGRLIVNDDLQNAHFVKRIVYQPIADRFVSDGAYAIEQFMKKV